MSKNDAIREIHEIHRIFYQRLNAISPSPLDATDLEKVTNDAINEAIHSAR